MAGTGGHMMQGLIMAGVSNSGYGVSIGGFHCATIEFGARLNELKSQIGNISLAASHEEQGYVSFVSVRNDYASASTPLKTISFRRENQKFFSELSSFLRSLKAQFVKQVVLTESYGSMQMILLYQPAPGMDETNA